MSGDKPTLLAMFPLRVVLLPGMSLPLHIFEPRYKALTSHCLTQSLPFGVVLEDDERSEVGCSAEILRVVRRYDDERLDILTVGRERFRVRSWNEEQPYLRADVEWLADDDTVNAPVVAEVRELYKCLIGFHGSAGLPAADSQIPLSFSLARSELFGLTRKQRILELGSEADRLECVRECLNDAMKLQRVVQGNGRLH